MAEGAKGISPADVTRHLRGAHFPARKRELMREAKQDGASPEMLRLLDDMQDREFPSIATVTHALANPDRSPE
jgi:hypothetical protein